ncbi:glycoside hydrolase family 18 protein [Mucilaginibacter sp. 21P]|uniref:glycoside hydrolase family 18 protein n=1 Tax=Mucilaginibacter sp. 21P TaxID=2778902 RepID=UPI001C74DA39|nr:glycoside hydrolase family 18 protein [Mucilaginibacter sp. 21P]QXV67481.1 glycoside hydrolase family 18 protein [Mucilaginibacter sp. 21P]
MLKLRLFFTAFILMSVASSAFSKPPKKKKYVIIGYVGGYQGLFDTSMVDASKLTHINYAFVDVQQNRAWLTHERTDTTNFKNLIKLKKKNPNLKILISIGGWTWSSNFSDMALSDTSRRGFAKSAVNIIKKYKMDGIDIDWEYPDNIGAGNRFRPVDKQNYTLMFKALRHELNVLQKETGKKLLLTAAVGGFKRFLQHTEMNKVANYLDYVNMMTYDYFQDSLGIAVHHTNLFASKKYVTRDNADKAIKEYVAAGVPCNKLVMGMAFYGRSSSVADSTNWGLGVKTVEHMRGGGYTFIKDSLLINNAFKEYRDTDAMAPYLYNRATKQFISYDNEWSVQKKCEYVKKNGLAGVMFWEYADDKKEYLLKQVNTTLRGVSSK